MELRAVIAEHILFQFRSRYLDLHCTTARERYDLLMQRCPGIVEHLDLQDIASFLNVSSNAPQFTNSQIHKFTKTREGTAEQVFDRQNNDFGWAHLPKSFMNQNTVFLLITAMAANFYRYIVALPLMAVLFGIKATDRVKSFLFRFIAVPAKWIKTARQYKLNIYSEKPYDLIWEHG